MGKQRDTIKQLNTDNVEAGMSYSYKELCEKLELPIKAGNMKKTQLEEINRFMKLLYKEKEKKYKITRIYDEPKAEIYKYSSTNIYSKYLGYLILRSLLNKPGNTICMSITPLCNEFGFINYNYTKYYYNREELIDKLNQIGINANIFDIDYIYEQCNYKFNQIVETALNGLQKRKLIDWGKPKIVCRHDKYSGVEYSSEANEKEIELTIKVERKILLDLNCKDEHEVHIKGLSKVYQKRCNDLIEELTAANPDYEYKIINYWRAYKIHYSSTVIPQAIEEDKETLNKMCLNAEVMKFFTKKTKELDNKYLTKRQNNELNKKLSKEINSGNFDLDEDDIVDFLIKDDVVPTSSINNFEDLENFLNDIDEVNEVIDEINLQEIKNIHNSTYELLVQLSPDVYDTLIKEKKNEKRRKG